MQARCEKQKRDIPKVEREVGRLLGQNTRAAGLFDVDVDVEVDVEVEVKPDADGHAKLSWKKVNARQNWATLSSGCYLLRSNFPDWSDEELWTAYIQLTEAEAGAPICFWWIKKATPSSRV